jgi:putative ABC transport system permease protein
VMRLVLLQGGKLVTLGLMLGVMTAVAGTRLLASLLYGVGSTDLVTYAITITILSLAALVAILLPAFRAARVDPMVALRQE